MGPVEPYLLSTLNATTWCDILDLEVRTIFLVTEPYIQVYIILPGTVCSSSCCKLGKCWARVFGQWVKEHLIKTKCHALGVSTIIGQPSMGLSYTLPLPEIYPNNT